MQYILSQEEMDKVTNASAKLKKLPDLGKLQEFCTFVSNNLILAEGWGCMLTIEREWYCDECPAKDVCPYDNKHWSK